jgi:hypothetical protein
MDLLGQATFSHPAGLKLTRRPAGQWVFFVQLERGLLRVSSIASL